jgi:hypothetical protein
MCHLYKESYDNKYPFIYFIIFYRMAHIVDATPSSSAGAAQLFAAAAALEDGLEDVTDYSSINRWEAISGTRA